MFANQMFFREIKISILFENFRFFLLISTAKKGTYIIDCSTIDVRTSKEMAEMARNKNLHFVDAPVSGGLYCISIFVKF